MTEFNEIEWQQSIIELRQANQAKVSELVSKLEDLAKSIDASRLFVSTMTNMTIGIPEEFSELVYGTSSVKGELLAYHLFPFFGFPSEKEVTPFHTNYCLDILAELFTARTVVSTLIDPEKKDDPIDRIINKTRSYAEIVRGSAYPEQTASEIVEIQGRFESWFISKIGIGPTRAQSVLWAIQEVMEKKLNALIPDIFEHARKFKEHWKITKRKVRRDKQNKSVGLTNYISSKKSAWAFGFIQRLNALAPDSIPVSRTELTNLDQLPDELEWKALIELIGLTPTTRNTIHKPIEVRQKPLYVLPDNRVYLGDISNAQDALLDQFEKVAKSEEKFFEKYQHYRGSWLEEQTQRHLSKIFPTRGIYRNLSYPDPEKAIGAAAELDLAIKWGPFLVLVEAKAKQFRLESQLGDAGRLRTDLKANIEDAFDQAKRAAKYITETDEPVFTEINSGRLLKINKHSILKIYMLTISHHHLAGLATRLTSLQDLGLFRDNEFPLSISIADLEIICEFCDGPDVLLHYIQKRLDIQHGTIDIIADELDLWGAYLDTRLRGERLWESYKRNFNFAYLSGWSDQFDTWMMFKRGKIKQAPTITLNVPQEIKGLLVELRDRSDEWARWIAFALLDLSDDALLFIAKGLRELRQARLTPGYFRRIVHQDNETVISIVASLDLSPELLEERTEMRAVIEKYRRKCSKSIGFGVMVVDKTRPFHIATWLDGPWEYDKEIENLIKEESEILPAPGEKLPGRNELCICGSGTKFKKCCLPKISTHSPSMTNTPDKDIFRS